MTSPLASLLRPTTLDLYMGQSHLVGEGKPLRLALERSHPFSMILWGPPGVGKTTLARLLATAWNADFVELSAVSASKDDIRSLVKKAESSKGKLGDPYRLVLFLDEIHRFSKSQQDFLLPYVESGLMTLIGATTENPSFEVIGALLSRARVFVLQPLTEAELHQLIERAIVYLHTQSGLEDLVIEPDVRTFLIGIANGDARQMLSILQLACELYGVVTVDSLTNAAQSPKLRYDKQGEDHHNTISAFIKSMRASNTDAALYYLARMVESGEDPLFIARRMVIFASEDIGVAVPTALVVANAVFDACSKIGYPEAQISLAHGVVYLSQCAKSRKAYDAYFKALEDVKTYQNLPIPMKLRNAPTKLMKAQGYGKGYEMYGKESLLPDKLKGKTYWES